MIPVVVTIFENSDSHMMNVELGRPGLNLPLHQHSYHDDNSTHTPNNIDHITLTDRPSPSDDPNDQSTSHFTQQQSAPARPGLEQELETHQSCLEVGDDLHVYFNSRPASHGIGGPADTTSPTFIHEERRPISSSPTSTTPKSQDSGADGDESPRGRSRTRSAHPSPRPQDSDLPPAERQDSRTSVESYGRHALDHYVLDMETESYLEIPIVDVPGAFDHQTDDGWALTDQVTVSSSDSSLSSTHLRAQAFSGHRDTFARIRFHRRHHAPLLPTSTWQIILRSLNHQDFLSLRLSSTVWSRALPPPYLPSSYHVPTEIIQQMYLYLNPRDFNAARHTCRSWLVASLDRNILALMLRRGGWWRAAEADLEIWREQHWSEHSQADPGLCTFTDATSDGSPSDTFGEVWLLSKRLATECALWWDWKGPALRSMPKSERMAQSATVDFSLLVSSHDQQPNVTFKQFTVSTCGKFTLVAQDCVIYVYRMCDSTPSIEGVTSIICPRKVMAVSMDTSSQRYSVAALLEGRMGLVCDIQNTITTTGTSGAKARKRITFSNAMGGDDLPEPRITRHHRSLSHQRAKQAGTRFFRRRTRSQSSPGTPMIHTYVTTSSDISSNDTGLPIELGQRSIYRNLCSVDDPARSVAICPQRRCVAFGCRLGIELHWVDALTGQDLNRWFPLAAPSDYLFFLPPRRGVDSAKKLRLISSAAGPEVDSNPSYTGTNRRWHFYGQHTQSMSRLFFGSLPVPAALGLSNSNDHDIPGRLRQQELIRAVDCDHFRAIPLSDGTHMLFTDPEMGCLCVGSDAPLGAPNKLLRKIICLPPAMFGAPPRSRSEADMSVALRMQRRPMTYATGSDVRWGVRIVAVYPPDQIVLFCVPPDLFEDLKDPTTLETGITGIRRLMAHSDLLMDAFAAYEEAPENAAINGVGSVEQHLERPGPMRSARLHGVEIGRMNNVVDLSVDCANGGLKIWTFSSGGEARAWNICTERPQDRTILKTRVRSDGTVDTLGEFDSDGDAVMADSSESLATCTSSLRDDTSSLSPPPTRDSPPTDETLSANDSSRRRSRHVRFFDGTSSEIDETLESLEGDDLLDPDHQDVETSTNVVVRELEALQCIGGWSTAFSPARREVPLPANLRSQTAGRGESFSVIWKRSGAGNKRRRLARERNVQHDTWSLGTVEVAARSL